MAYKLKTLIVFDTNSLRSTEAGEVAYSFFAFGRPFQMVEEFILEKDLSEDIHIAIPTWAIEELKDQKHRQYKTDIIEFQKLAKRLSGMPHIPELALPEEEFDCTTYIQEKAQEYLATKSIKLLEIKEELANTVLQSMMKRVMKDQNKKQPFAHTGKYKDAGFKDNIVWESLMHFDGVTDFDKVIFITKDGDYANCEVEFKDKWNRHIAIEKDENNAIAEIQKDYELYIKERTIYDFTQTDYFKDYLADQLKKKSEILIEGENFKIENFKLIDMCTDISRVPPNEHMIESLYVNSQIVVYYSDNGEKKELIVSATTSFADEETKEIIETFYDFDLT
ncbi:PIN domain-containing protein [Parapedobacter tibetensis]|uniref:PIN domain-containing protein n=1 Tax=Parapedobacter tibetensis TaxID=2972951 RepID=UPI00214D14C5|nr:PIN domain-containing protein [Parapedobacter tibetensis]